MRFNIISVDEYGITRLEMASILGNLNVNILNANNENDVFNLLNNKKCQIHAIIWSFNRDDSDCFAAIRRLKNKEPYKNIPVIIVSQFTDKRYIIKAIESGAGEYVVKPYDRDTVLRKICKILGIQYNNRGKSFINEDILTFNFSEMLNREIKAAGRGNHALSILLISVIQRNPDNRTADEIEKLVQDFCRVIKTRFRETDTCFRYGSDSLIVLLPFADKKGAELVERKVTESFNNHSILKQQNAGCTLVTASVSFPDDGKVKEKLLEILEENFAACIKNRKV